MIDGEEVLYLYFGRFEWILYRLMKVLWQNWAEWADYGVRFPLKSKYSVENFLLIVQNPLKSTCHRESIASHVFTHLPFQ